MAERFSPSVFIVTFAVATLLFIVGILIGSAMTEKKVEQILDFQETLRLEMQDLELQGQLSGQNPCNSQLLYSLGERIDDLGSRLTMLEDQLGKNDARIIELKKPYTLLMIQHYFLTKKRIDSCHENYIIILFFYSNKPEQVDKSKEQGYVLDYLAKKYGYDKVKVYSLDADLSLGIINALKDQYNVTEIPTTVINDKIFVGFHSQNELEKEIVI